MTLEIGVWPPHRCMRRHPNMGITGAQKHIHEGKESRVSTLFDLSLLPVVQYDLSQVDPFFLKLWPFALVWLFFWFLVFFCFCLFALFVCLFWIRHFVTLTIKVVYTICNIREIHRHLYPPLKDLLKHFHSRVSSDGDNPNVHHQEWIHTEK